MEGNKVREKAFIPIWVVSCEKVHLLSIDTFYCVKRICQRTTNALITLRGCAGWSGPLLSAHARKYIFPWHDPYNFNTSSYLFTYSFIYLVIIIYLFIYSFIYMFIYLFIYLFIRQQSQWWFVEIKNACEIEYWGRGVYCPGGLCAIVHAE